MRRSAPIRLALSLASLSILPQGGQAQAPGYQQLDNRTIMAEYHAEVIQQVNRLMSDWGEAWAADDVDALSELYWENAVLIPVGGGALRGRDAIRDYLATSLPDQGGIEAFMLDFDASGGMAVVYGNYMVQVN